MAGGIDWLRWHHGSVTDPKFQLVARKAGCRLPDVLAVWAFVLEKASSADRRGTYGDVDCEAVDCLFGLDEGTTASILMHMEARALLADGAVCAWEKRQPKREDVTAADRKRLQREREHELRAAACVTGDVSRDVTHGHDRGEERREEKNSIPSEANASGASAPPADPPGGVEPVPADPAEIIFGLGVPLLTAAGVSERNARSMLGLMRKTHGDEAVAAAIGRCSIEKPLEPVAWLQAAIKPRSKASKHTGFDDKDYRAGVTADGFIA